jgi:hypothetical protein
MIESFDIEEIRRSGKYIYVEFQDYTLIFDNDYNLVKELD